MKLQCEGCLKPATHCCSGLDVPALNFCASCARIHKRECSAVRSGSAAVVKMGADTEARAMKRHTDEIAELVKHGRMRNRMLTAKAMQAEVRDAARRVVRLSQPGGIKSGDIVDAILAEADERTPR